MTTVNADSFSSVTVDQVERVVEERAKRATAAMDFYSRLIEFAEFLIRDNPHDLPVIPISKALEDAQSSAYEEILLWKTARAELRRRIEAVSERNHPVNAAQK